MTTIPNTVTRNEFAWREECCPECRGSGVRMGEIECFDCSGEGSWSASCAECREEKPLNGDGLCAECAALGAVLDLSVSFTIPSRVEEARMRALPEHPMRMHDRFIEALCQDWQAAGTVTRDTPRANAVYALDRELRKRGERK